MNSETCWRVVVALIVTINVGMPTDSHAQTRAQITGSIRSDAGEPLSAVAVVLKSPTVPGEPQRTITNARGAYRFAGLPAAVYELTATLQGWQTVKRNELRVAVGITVVLD